MCVKRFRYGDREHVFENCSNILDFIVAKCPLIVRNLLKLAVHRGCLICHNCYLLLYQQAQSQRGDRNVSRNDDTIDVDSENEPSYSHRVGIQVDRDWCRDQSTQTADMSLFTVTTSDQTTSATNLSLFRPIYSHQKCSACKITFSSTLSRRVSVITDKARVDALLNHHILFQSRSRCCSIHFTEGLVNNPAVNMITSGEKKQCELNNCELMDLFSIIKADISLGKVIVEQTMELPPLNLNDHSRLSSTSSYILTGLTRNDFDRLCSFIPSWVLRESVLRTPRLAIACALCKLRLGITDRTLAVLFSLSDERTVSRINNSVCKVSDIRHLSKSKY
jgi:hypothetical protein